MLREPSIPVPYQAIDSTNNVVQYAMDSGTPTSDDPAFGNADEMFAKRGYCCFWVPWSGTTTWERIRPTPTKETNGGVGSLGRWCWSRGRKALMKVREWSELVAGPRWKTFIRRFRRVKSRCGGGSVGGGSCKGGRSGGGKFRYDPLSYALNFDDGQGQNNDSDEDNVRRGFSARYASLPSSAKSSMDLGEHYVPPPLIQEE